MEPQTQLDQAINSDLSVNNEKKKSIMVGFYFILNPYLSGVVM